MRLGEICNIRLSDIDLRGYRIFVRLPNKTMTERFAFFGEKAKELITAWMDDRDPNCGHNFLFHNKEGNPCRELQVQLELKHVLCKSLRGKKLHEDGLDSWSIHRMRHTMASRLAHAGADYSTIQGAGGWKTASAMVGYTRSIWQHERMTIPPYSLASGRGESRPGRSSTRCQPGAGSSGFPIFIPTSCATVMRPGWPTPELTRCNSRI